MCSNFSRYGHRGLGPGSIKSSLDWIGLIIIKAYLLTYNTSRPTVSAATFIRLNVLFKHLGSDEFRIHTYLKTCLGYRSQQAK